MPVDTRELPRSTRAPASEADSAGSAPSLASISTDDEGPPPRNRLYRASSSSGDDKDRSRFTVLDDEEEEAGESEIPSLGDDDSSSSDAPIQQLKIHQSLPQERVIPNSNALQNRSNGHNELPGMTGHEEVQDFKELPLLERVTSASESAISDLEEDVVPVAVQQSPPQVQQPTSPQVNKVMVLSDLVAEHIPVKPKLIFAGAKLRTSSDEESEGDGAADEAEQVKDEEGDHPGEEDSEASEEKSADLTKEAEPAVISIEEEKEDVQPKEVRITAVRMAWGEDTSESEVDDPSPEDEDAELVVPEWHPDLLKPDAVRNFGMRAISASIVQGGYTKDILTLLPQEKDRLQFFLASTLFHGKRKRVISLYRLHETFESAAHQRDGYSIRNDRLSDIPFSLPVFCCHASYANEPSSQTARLLVQYNSVLGRNTRNVVRRGSSTSRARQ
ncbi:hypothetical protein BT69DRAFT_727994 [Atractiella rhizophila]|nr:hypothetical protein BT69DRAFT_727994 [Atractiella rhizophila]